MSIDIIHIDEHNAERLGNVTEDVFDAPIDLAKLSAYVAAPNHIMMIAVCDDMVVGQTLAVIHRHPDKPTELYIDDLGVAPSFQRQGVASRLLDAVKRVGAAQGCEELWVATEPGNEEAKSFYHALGLASRTAVVFEGTL